MTNTMLVTRHISQNIGQSYPLWMLGCKEIQHHPSWPDAFGTRALIPGLWVTIGFQNSSWEIPSVCEEHWFIHSALLHKKLQMQQQQWAWYCSDHHPHSITCHTRQYRTIFSLLVDWRMGTWLSLARLRAKLDKKVNLQHTGRRGKTSSVCIRNIIGGKLSWLSCLENAAK